MPERELLLLRGKGRVLFNEKKKSPIFRKGGVGPGREDFFCVTEKRKSLHRAVEEGRRSRHEESKGEPYFRGKEAPKGSRGKERKNL